MQGAKLARLFDLARREKVRACCYEMGLGLGSSDNSKAAKIAVNRDPRLRPITQRYLELWFETAPDVADVACWFTAAGRWHGKGSYGATDDAKDLAVPKVRAIATVSAKHQHEQAAVAAPAPAPQPAPAPAPEPAPPGTEPGKAQSLRRAIDDVEAANEKLEAAQSAARDAQAEFRAKWEMLKQTADVEAARDSKGTSRSSAKGQATSTAARRNEVACPSRQVLGVTQIRGPRLRVLPLPVLR
jgi:hypothetical protein